MIEVRRLGHATLTTPDLDRQVAYYTEVVGLTLLERDSAETRVGDAEAFTRIMDFDPQEMRIVGIQSARRFDVDRAFRGASAGSGPGVKMLVVLEGAVLNQLGVQPAIGAEVDVFEERAPHGRADLRARLVGRDVDPDRLRCSGWGRLGAVRATNDESREEATGEKGVSDHGGHLNERAA